MEEFSDRSDPSTQYENAVLDPAGPATPAEWVDTASLQASQEAWKVRLIQNLLPHVSQVTAPRKDAADWSVEGRAWASLGEWKNAAESYREAAHLTSKRDRPHYLFALGTALIQLGRQKRSDQFYEDAIHAFDRAIKFKQKYPEAYTNRGYALARLGRLEEAVKAHQHAIKLRPDDPEGHYHLGYALARLGRLEEALEANSRALELRPNYPEAYNNRGYALSLSGRSEEALVAYDQALLLRPNYNNAYTNRGIVLARLGSEHFQEALEDFNRALQLGDDDYTFLARGITLANMGRREEALEDFARALELQPDYPAAHYNRSRTLARMGLRDEALKSIARALELLPDYAEAHYQRGYILAGMGMGHRDEALQAINRALELRPDYAEAHYEQGYILARLRRGQEALEAYKRALVLRPEYPEALFETARTLCYSGQPHDALVWLEKAIAADEMARVRARTDTAFNTFRAHPELASRFQTLVGE